MAKELEDLTGQQFGRLTVLYPMPRKNGRTIWHCICSCENHTEVDVGASNLKKGATKSCGCLQKELARERRKKYNTYDLTSFDYGVGYTNKGEEFYFDIEDYDKIKDYCWYIDTTGYVEAKEFDGSGKHIKMHNLVMGQKYNDHIGGNTTRNDNRKSNLRIANDSNLSFESINNMNKALQRNNKYGVAGVTWHKRDNIWESHITVNRKQIYLGRSTNFDDAVRLRKQAEEQYFGKYSRDNSIRYAENNSLDGSNLYEETTN